VVTNSQVTASHQCLTAGSQKIFPEYVDLADESDSPPVNCPISGIPTRDGERRPSSLAGIAEKH
jgi:hypothetical protein